MLLRLCVVIPKSLSEKACITLAALADLNLDLVALRVPRDLPTFNRRRAQGDDQFSFELTQGLSVDSNGA